MTRAIRAELLKLFTTRLWWGMAIGLFLGAAAFAVLFGWIYTSDLPANGAEGPSVSELSTPTQIANGVYTAGLSVGYLLLLTIGVMQIGMEYRHKTITSTFLAIPRRGRAMTAKIVALMLIGVGYGVISMLGSVLPGAAMLQVSGFDPFPSSEVLRTLLLSLLVLGLWALIGLGIGILIPNQIAALLIGVGVAWIVEPLIGFALSFFDFTEKYVVPYLPSSATQAIVNGPLQSEGAVRLDWWVGALTLAAWAAVLAGIGTWRTIRQDIS